MKTKWLLTIIAGASLAGLTSASAVSVTTGFGSIPGTTQAQNPYSGSGIPINTSEYAVITGLGDDTLTLAMAATQHGAGNPAPGNNNAGTYTVSPGLVGGRSTWNFDFYGNSKLGHLANYIFTLTITANGQTFSFTPTTIADNVGGPNSFGNSESLDFPQYGLPINYDPNANDTYKFDLSVSSVTGGPVIADVPITVIAGRGAAAPDSGSTALLLGLGFAGIAIVGYRKNRLALATTSK